MKKILIAICMIFFATLSVAEDKLQTCQIKGEVAAIFSRYRIQGIPKEYALERFQKDMELDDEGFARIRNNSIPMLNLVYSGTMRSPAYDRRMATEMCFRGEM